MNYQFLNVEEYAQRLNVGRTTIFGWLRSGILVQGIHYFKVGHTLRFVWGDGVIELLLESLKDSDDDLDVDQDDRPVN